jgi:hypothetical protein
MTPWLSQVDSTSSNSILYAATLPFVSYDLYFWPSGLAHDPGGLAQQLADEQAAAMEPSERVLTLRAELLRRWPDLADRIAPWHHDLGWRQPWGRTDLADRFIGLTLPYGWEHTAELPELARQHGMDCYDPQCDALLHPTALHGTGDRHGIVPSVHGRVNEDDLVELFEHISRQIGYAYDDLDEAALNGALDQTNDESADGWFLYPLAGTPPLTVRLAQSPRSRTVSVRVEGDMDPKLAARIETVLEPL